VRIPQSRYGFVGVQLDDGSGRRSSHTRVRRSCVWPGHRIGLVQSRRASDFRFANVGRFERGARNAAFGYERTRLLRSDEILSLKRTVICSYWMTHQMGKSDLCSAHGDAGETIGVSGGHGTQIGSSNILARFVRKLGASANGVKSPKRAARGRIRSVASAWHRSSSGGGLRMARVAIVVLICKTKQVLSFEGFNGYIEDG